MKIGIIGTGTMGRNHARVYSEFKGVEDIYVFDLNKNNVNEMRKLGFIVCDSVDELLDYVEAVSICVPTKYHLEVAKAAIEKNVPCLIEKPVTISVEEGEKLLNILKNKNLIVGVGQIERFNPIINEIKKMIVNPFFVELRRHNPLSSRVTDSSVVEDLMIHDIDIVFNVLFNNDSYKIYSGGTADVCKAMVVFGGSIASISASRRACKKIRTIYIEDENFTIEGDFMAQEIYTYWKPEKYGIDREKYTQENIIEKVLVNKVEPLKVELRTFIDCVKKNTEFPVTPEQALNNLRICEKIKTGFE
ncbi:MAG: Gfo/Idh/MocA family oxidoreductase [Candidatus Methanoperedens sp.]|nr:Gfo/Idh/MocA family oxidoreductase [Candidatus Methanoperedens sp.]